MSREEAVYYREIQKTAYLKRVIDDGSGKLRPVTHKRAPLKSQWTVFCVHNGRTPYLEQYPRQEDASALAHRPAWRASLETARHVTASVRPWPGGGHDFLVSTDEGPVRMIAPDWETMQDWVVALRSKLHELKVVARGQNVYGAPPAPPPQRAGTRDPTSPLPPTPPIPAIRVPGIEPIAPSSLRQSNNITHDSPTDNIQSSTDQQTAPSDDVNETRQENLSETTEPIEETRRSLERLNWNEAIQLASQSTTSQEIANSEMASSSKVAKICGQNICLDESILQKRLNDSYTDDDFFAEIDKINSEKAVGEFVEDDQVETVSDNTEVSTEETLKFDERIDSYKVEKAPPSAGETNLDKHKQRLIISEESTAKCDETQTNSNVTVIQVSNREPPHTAIPVLTPDNVFDFEFKQQLSVNGAHEDSGSGFVNIVNTDDDNGYGTIYRTSDYGQLSLTTTVNLTGNDEGIYEKLCMASTSSDNVQKSSLSKNKSINQLKLTNGRKTSLPNLESTSNDANPTYEYLFPVNCQRSNGNIIDNDSVGNQSSTAETSMSSNKSVKKQNTLSNKNNEAQIPNSSMQTTVNANLTGVLASTETSRSPSRRLERGHSQTSYDDSFRLMRDRARNILVRNQNHNPRREGVSSKNDKNQQESRPSKGLFKRGLTELSFLSRLRTLGQTESKQPSRETTNSDLTPPRGESSPVKVVRRSRLDARSADPSRRRSSSLTGASERQPLRVRQAAALRAEQARGAAVPARLSRQQAERDPPVLFDMNQHVWVARWGRGGAWFCGRAGDRVAAVRGARPRDAAHARQLLRQAPSGPSQTVDILFHRVPHAKIYILYKVKDDEDIGIKLDSECGIARVTAGSPAARAGLPPADGARYAVTEINGRPLNLLQGGQEQVSRLSGRCEEVSVLLQPLALVQKLRAALKSQRSLLTS